MYEKRTLDSSVRTDFSSPPSLEVDAAWHELLTCMCLALQTLNAEPTTDSLADNNLVVSAEDLTRLDRTSVPLVDGSGYLASLSVFHQLHCLGSAFISFIAVSKIRTDLCR